jgi:Fe-Mn family superoxide dismutase
MLMNDSSRSVDRREALAAIGLAAASLPSLAMAQPPSITSPNSPPPKDGSKPPIAVIPSNTAPSELKIFDEASGQFVLPALPYAKDALEPHIDAQTMEIHHGKHHAAYVSGANKALAELARIRTAAGDSALIKHWANQVSFHLSGHVNHALFWNMLAPAGKGGGGAPGGELAKAIAASFGSFEQFVAQFKATATAVEGGGWAWLAVEPWSKQLVLIQQEKQQDMWVTGAQPVLGIDVWEHAYYLKYQNKRADYVAAFLNVVNWRFCESLFLRAVR